jgi:hypothetical protein
LIFKNTLSILQEGKWQEGFQELLNENIQEWYGKERLEWKSLSCPIWEGQDLDNKSLAIMTDGGIGDAILFSRYFHLIKERWPSCKIHYPGNDNVLELFKEYQINEGTTQKFDYKTSQLALPMVFKTTIDTIPQDPGLILKHIKSFINKTSSKTFKIGLCWKANILSPRDIPLKLLLQLSSPNLTLYSLQFPTPKIQLEKFNARDQLVDLVKEDYTWVDTAKSIFDMDLVISVDTGVAHLSGALQIPTWLLLPKDCAWFWLKDRSDCIWYPTIKLFRQKIQGDWTNVIHEVKKHTGGIELLEGFDK